VCYADTLSPIKVEFRVSLKNEHGDGLKPMNFNYKGDNTDLMVIVRGEKTVDLVGQLHIVEPRNQDDNSVNIDRRLRTLDVCHSSYISTKKKPKK